MKKEIAGMKINVLTDLSGHLDNSECSLNVNQEVTFTNVSFINCTFLLQLYDVKYVFRNCDFVDCNFNRMNISKIDHCSFINVTFNNSLIEDSFALNVILQDTHFNRCSILCNFIENAFSNESSLIFTGCTTPFIAKAQNLKYFQFIDCDMDYSVFKLSCKFQFKADKAICQQIVAHAVRILELSNEGEDIIDGMKNYIKGWKHERDF